MYLNRARYLLQFTYPLVGSLYTAASDEIWLGFGHHVNYNTFDQNRAYAALGHKINKNAALEVGYMNQRLEHGGIPASLGSHPVFENNNTLMVTLNYGLDLRSAAPVPSAPDLPTAPVQQ